MGDVRLDDEIGELDLAIQQKIEIARAIFRKPRILLLDEPTRRSRAATSIGSAHIIADQRARASRSSSSRIGCAKSARSATR